VTSQSSPKRRSSTETSVPVAEILSRDPGSARRFKTRLWWLTALCLVVSAGLVVSSIQRDGIPITVRFQEGHGLKIGDTLRYRGIDIGRVTKLELSEDQQAIDVQIRVLPGNERLVVEDTQFWIQRARVSLGQVSGLETVLGAKYVGVLPGRSSITRTSFVGLDMPLTTQDGDTHECRIFFDSGLGLQVGSPVRYRGLTIGEVSLIELASDRDGVLATVYLSSAARSLTREGTQFWIEQPRLELTEIRGLEALVSGSYIVLEPGPAGAEVTTEFTGLAHPPPLPRKEGSLEVQLDASQRWGIVRGAPIVYRGMEVGSVAHVGLSSDGATVRMTAVIDRDYTELVRDNSQWWAVSGVRWRLGLTGMELSLDSFSAWLRGGIAFATPPSPGKNIVSGHRFTLHERAQDDWQDWQPRIAIAGWNRTEEGREAPTPLRVVASWRTSVLGISRRRTEKCWSLALSDGMLVLPKQLVDALSRVGSSVTLEIEGISVAFLPDKVEMFGVLAKHPLPAGWKGTMWDLQQIPGDLGPGSVLLVINPELTEPIAIDQGRLEMLPGVGWKIATTVAISAQLNGSSVVDAGTGRLVGLISKTDSGWAIGRID
jgi:paraquat-inducible protein B